MKITPVDLAILQVIFLSQEREGRGPLSMEMLGQVVGEILRRKPYTRAHISARLLEMRREGLITAETYRRNQIRAPSLELTKKGKELLVRLMYDTLAGDPGNVLDNGLPGHQRQLDLL